MIKGVEWTVSHTDTQGIQRKDIQRKEETRIKSESVKKTEKTEINS